MGCHKNITIDKFPKHGEQLGNQVKVCFHYDTDNWIGGKIVRDDMEEPYLTIIRLDDGRHVLGSECQYLKRWFEILPPNHKQN